jgi:hypothetical protein
MRKKSKARAKKKSSRSTSAKRRTTRKTAAKRKTTKKRVARKRVAKKRKVGTRKKSTRKKTTRKTAAKKKAKKKVKRKAKKKAKKKVAKKRSTKKKTKKKAKKKTAKRKAGKKKRRSRKKAAKKAPAAPMSIHATRLTIALRQAEGAMDKVSNRLVDARDRVARAAMTARLKRSETAHAAADRAREALAAINERRVEVTDRLKAASDAFKGQHKTDLDWHKREQAVKEALERFEEKFLRGYDRKVARRGKKRPKTAS